MTTLELGKLDQLSMTQEGCTFCVGNQARCKARSSDWSEMDSNRWKEKDWFSEEGA